MKCECKMIYKTPITFYVIFFMAKGIFAIGGVNKIEDISAEALIVNNTLSLKIRWNATIVEGTNLDIDINTKTDNYCPASMCDEYGQPLSNVTEIILPRGHIPFTEHDECNLKPGCTYDITVKTSSGKSSKSITYTIPNCVGHICACKHESLLPKPQISAEMLPNNTIRVNWNISLVNISHIKFPGVVVSLKQIYIRMNQHTKTSLPWHGIAYTMEASYPIFHTIETAQNNGIIRGSKIIKINSTILSETKKFSIFAHVLDNLNCQGSDGNFLIDCVESKCSCKHDLLLPSVQFSAEVLANSSIQVNWSCSLANRSLINLLEDGVILKDVYIRIDRHIHTSLAWETVGTYYSPLEVYKFEENKIIKGSKIVGMGSTILPETKFKIIGYIMDNFNCQGPERKLFLTVPPNASDLHQTGTSFHSVFISIIFPTVLIVLATVCVIHYIYKNLRKSTSSPNWMSIYRNTTPLGNIHPIPMEENLLYTDKDNLAKSDVFEIPYNRITFEHEIGRGAFGKVYKAIAQKTFSSPGPIVVAVKKLKRSLDSGAKEEFLGEIQTMKNVGKHDNVVELLGYCTVKEPFIMIMEYVKYGNLIDYLHTIRYKHSATSIQQLHKRAYLAEKQESIATNSLQKPQLKYLEIKHSASTVSEDSYIIQPDAHLTGVRPSITETTYTMLSQKTNRSSKDSIPALDYILDNKELHNFAIQIAKGMRHLEEKGITHRDLAARNVLIDEGKVLKISDFGLSRQGIYINTKSKQVPLRWLSLEAMRDNLYSSKSDVWAFGVVLWEIGTLGAFPYPTINNQELLHFLSSGQRLEKPEICSDFLYEMMVQCWNEYPSNRPSFKEIVNKLQPQNQRIYVEFSSLGSDYVFPPTKEQVLENKNKADNIESCLKNN